MACPVGSTNVGGEGEWDRHKQLLQRRLSVKQTAKVISAEAKNCLEETLSFYKSEY